MQLFPTVSQREPGTLRAAYLAVGVGGAVGASLRWAIGSAFTVPVGSWPWSTLFINLVGCAVIGVASRRLTPGTLRWDGIVTGLLGGFTTMSSFALELNDMVDADRTALALAYGTTTLAGGLAAILLGQAAIARKDSSLSSPAGSSSS